MELRHLRYFLAVAEEQHIGRAALRLRISQPPLTRAIQQLEEELGVRLFERTPRGVELTAAGHALQKDAGNILSLVEQAAEHSRRAGQGQLGRLDIGIFGTGILDAIPKLLHLFRASHPDVRVVLHTMSKREQIEALRQKRITVGFNRLLAPLPDIASELIMKEELFLAVNENHPLAALDPVPFRDIRGYPLVLFPDGARPNFVDFVLQLCRSKGFSPEVGQVVGDAVTGVALVASGFGITLVPLSATTLRVPGVLYRRLSNAGNAAIDLSCIYRKDDGSAILAEFLATVADYRASL